MTMQVRVIDGGTDCGTGTIIERKGELSAVKFDNGMVLWLNINQIEILEENNE